MLDHIDVENWDVVYAQWKAQDITANEAAVKLGISKATLYRMEKGERYKMHNSHNNDIMVSAANL